MRRSLTIALLAGAAVTSQAHAQDSRQSRQFLRSTAPGRDVLVQHYGQWDQHCTPSGLPSVSVVTNPSHGSVSVRTGTEVVSNPPRVGATDCRGKTMPASLVWYTPAAGFKGRDSFVYEVHLPHGTLHDTAIVDVR